MNIMMTDNDKGCGKKISAPFYHIMYIKYIFFVFLFATTVYAEPEVRGLWVVRDSIKSRSDAEKLVDFAVTYNYNVIFLQVRGRGDAFYKSYFVPGPEEFPNIPDSFDPLATVIELAHARGIEVHAWFNMYLTWSGDNPPSNPLHLVNAHPSWFMVSLNGLNMAECPIDSVRNRYYEGRYISPGLEEVRSYLSRVITEVAVSYDINGVHLDYLRYPGRNFDFNGRVRQQFYGHYGVDSAEVLLKGEKFDPSFEYLNKWIEYRTSPISEQVRSIARRINLVNKDIRLSVAVKPDSDEAFYEFGQNWVSWINDGIVNFVVTMTYFPETAWVEDVLNDSLNKVDRRKVVGGIGAYKLTPEETAEQVKLMHNLNLLGYSIFSYSTFIENPHFAESLDSLIVSYNITPPAESKSHQR